MSLSVCSQAIVTAVLQSRSLHVEPHKACVFDVQHKNNLSSFSICLDPLPPFDLPGRCANFHFTCSSEGEVSIKADAQHASETWTDQRITALYQELPISTPMRESLAALIEGLESTRPAKEISKATLQLSFKENYEATAYCLGTSRRIGFYWESAQAGHPQGWLWWHPHAGNLGYSYKKYYEAQPSIKVDDVICALQHLNTH